MEQPKFLDKLHDLLVKFASKDDTEYLVYNGDLDRVQADAFVRTSENRTPHKNVCVILTTYGGDADAAYRLARYLRRRYTRFTVLVDTMCKSAGTLLAIGAHEIVMTELGELGPLDVQIYKADEVGEFSSGLTPFKAMHTILDEAYAFFEDKFLTLRFASDGQITTHLAADIAAQLTTGLFSPILRQVDPMRIGELGRHVQIALDYGNRIGHNNLKEGALNKLISGYPSHGFIIDREEAEELFKTVRLPSTDEMQLMDLVRGPFAELSAHAPYKFFYLDDMIEKCSLEQEEAENGDGVGENPEDTAAKG